MKTIRLMFFLLLSAVAVCAAPVGSIKGYVRDASGAVIPSAGVTLINEKTGVEQKTISDSTGFYQFLDLNPGDYRVIIAVQGFRTTDVKGVVVLVDQIVGLDVKLEIGNVTQAVEVSGSQELLQTENAATGTNITAEMTASLPLANRQFTDLAVLSTARSVNCRLARGRLAVISAVMFVPVAAFSVCNNSCEPDTSTACVTFPISSLTSSPTI